MSAHDVETILALSMIAGSVAGLIIGLAVSMRGKR